MALAGEGVTLVRAIKQQKNRMRNSSSGGGFFPISSSSSFPFPFFVNDGAAEGVSPRGQTFWIVSSMYSAGGYGVEQPQHICILFAQGNKHLRKAIDKNHQSHAGALDCVTVEIPFVREWI